MPRFYLSVLFTTFACLDAHAQDQGKIPPPKMPVVIMPENAKWVLTLSPAASDNSKKPDPNAITSVSSVKTGKIKLDHVAYGDGHADTFWYLGNFLGGTFFLQDVHGKPFGTPVGPDWNLDGPSSPSGFPGTRWIKLENYTDTVTHDGQPCYHFKTTLDGTPWEAWVNALTHLPDAYTNGPVTCTYQFSPPPAAPLTLPDDFNGILADYQKTVDYTNKLQTALDYKSRLQQMGK